MNIDVVTLFPDLFSQPLSVGLVGKAIVAGKATVRTIDPRQYTQDRHRTVDDTPYGGGGGMVMKPEPMVAAIREARSRGAGLVVLMSPQGQPLTQADFQRWSRSDHLVLVAGRYEGYDERIRHYVDEEVSLGDFVLTGGEYAALTIIDGVIRLLPGTLGNQDCPEQDSFADGLIEYPHYTRPADFETKGVPEVLQSGHHQRVTEWRHLQSLLRTRNRRPDLLRRRGLTPAEATVLSEASSPPVLIAAPSARIDEGFLAIAHAYDVARVFAVAHTAEDRAALQARLDRLDLQTYPVREGPRPRKLRRAPPGTAEVDLRARLTVLDAWDALPEAWGEMPVVRLAASRRPPIDANFADPTQYAPASIHRPVPCLLIGGPEERAHQYLPVIRGHEPGNRLPPAAVLAIYLDRLTGEA